MSTHFSQSVRPRTGFRMVVFRRLCYLERAIQHSNESELEKIKMLASVSCNIALSKNLLHFWCHEFLLFFLTKLLQVPVGCGKPR